MLFNIASLLGASSLAAAAVVSSESKMAHAIERRQTAAQAYNGETDLSCPWNPHGQSPYKWRSGTPVAIYWTDGTSSCGCTSDIITPAPVRYVNCNYVYPSMRSPAYNASEANYEQNSCYIDDDKVAQCGTACAPNTSRQEDGSCYPTTPEYFDMFGFSFSSDEETQTSSATASSSATGSDVFTVLPESASAELSGASAES